MTPLAFFLLLPTFFSIAVTAGANIKARSRKKKARVWSQIELTHVTTRNGVCCGSREVLAGFFRSAGGETGGGRGLSVR